VVIVAVTMLMGSILAFSSFPSLELRHPIRSTTERSDTCGIEQSLDLRLGRSGILLDIAPWGVRPRSKLSA